MQLLALICDASYFVMQYVLIHCKLCTVFSMRVKKLPHVLALHLKRFKLEQPNRSIKLSYRVVFPLELRLFNTVGSNHGLFFLFSVGNVTC